MRTTLLLLGLALGVAVLNACKPLVVDDTVYYYYACHIAERPLDPYGFDLPGTGPAIRILAPPGLLYWWAGALRFLGDHPWLWKMSLFPFAFGLLFALHRLALRWAPGLEMPITVLVALSPAFLPSLNLMLDWPALALTLLALLAFQTSCDRHSWGGILFAGLLAGVAMQTKYTGLVAVGWFLLYGWFFGNTRAGILASFLAIGVFIAWELFLVATYGDSHFLLAVLDRRAPLRDKLLLVMPLVGLLGSTMAAALLFGLAALGASRKALWASGLFIAMGYFLLAFLPESWQPLLRQAGSGKPIVTWNNAFFGGMGLALFGLVVIASCQLWRSPAEHSNNSEDSHRGDLFLVLWLGLEIAGYFGLSPYPAVRRILGVILVMVLLLGRLAARRGVDIRPASWAAAGVSAMLGLLYFGVDYHHFEVERRVTEQLAERLQQETPAGKVWYFGDGTFDFYAARAGLHRLYDNSHKPAPEDRILALASRTVAICPPHRFLAGHDLVESWVVPSTLPVRTFICFYYGRTALEHHEGSLLEFRIYRPRQPQ